MSDIRDMRDPQALGEMLFKSRRSFNMSITEMADDCGARRESFREQGKIPDYYDEPSPLERYGRPQDLAEAYTDMEADGLTPRQRRVLD